MQAALFFPAKLESRKWEKTSYSNSCFLFLFFSDENWCSSISATPTFSKPFIPYKCGTWLLKLSVRSHLKATVVFASVSDHHVDSFKSCHFAMWIIRIMFLWWPSRTGSTGHPGRESLWGWSPAQPLTCDSLLGQLCPPCLQRTLKCLYCFIPMSQWITCI